MAGELFFIYTLLLRVVSVHASLPYSLTSSGILDPNRLIHTRLIVIIGSHQVIHRDSGTSESSLLLTSATTSSHWSTGVASSFQTDVASSAGQTTWTDSPPFPIGSNTTSAQVPGTSGFGPDVPLTQSASIFNPASTTASRTEGTAASSAGSSLATNNPVVIVTVTPSQGPPIVVTVTVTVPSPSPLSNSVLFTGELPGVTSRATQGSSDGGFVTSSMSKSAQPSQTPGADDGPHVQFPSPYVVDAVIEGQTYRLPHPDEPAIDIMLLDGSIAQLLAGKVTMRGQTLNIPSDLSNGQPITAGDESITARPGASQQPDSDDHDSGGGGIGIFGAIGKVVGTAGSAAKALGSVATGAAVFAGGAGGEAAGTLAGTFSSAASGVGDIVSQLNGIQMALPSDKLTKTGMAAFLGAQNLGRSSMDWMQSMGNMLASFESLKPSVQQQVRKNLGEYAKPGGLLDEAGDALKSFAKFPWEAEMPEAPDTRRPTPTGSAQPSKSAQQTTSDLSRSSQGTTSVSATTTWTTRMTTMTSSGSSSSGSAASTEAPIPYLLVTKSGTSLETFDKFIKDLDGGAGKAETHDMRIIDYQSYNTVLNRSQADGLRTKYPFLLLVHADVFDPKSLDQDAEEFHAIPRSDLEHIADIEAELDLQGGNIELAKPKAPNLSSRALLPEDPNAPAWKKMIGSPYQTPPLRLPSQDPPYITDDSGGRDTTIYVLDDGFDTTLPVSRLYGSHEPGLTKIGFGRTRTQCIHISSRQ
jgi:hypothetical protein